MVQKTLGQAVRETRKRLGMTQGDLAEMFHLSVAYVSKIEKGERDPSERTRIDLEEFIAGKMKSALPNNVLPVKEIPVLGRISAGFPDLASQEILEYISIPGTPENTIALVVKGRSMWPTLYDGDYVLFIENGEYKSEDVLIVLDTWGDAMVKRLKIRDGRKFLVSDNPEYPIIEPDENYRIIGKVVNVWRNIKF